MGPRLKSYVAVLAGQYHLSVRKTQSLLKDMFDTHFSTGLISEAQSRVSSMLTPTHQALHQHIKQSHLVHADETTHQRNLEQHTRWFWLGATDKAVFQTVRYSRDQQSAQFLLGQNPLTVTVTDQCGSYHWLPPERHQFCWAHIQRNFQKIADYSGGGLTAQIGQRLVLICQSVFRTQHRFEQGYLNDKRWRRRMLRLRAYLHYWLKKGEQVPVKRYAGRCKYALKYEIGLWVFLNYRGIPLTNNEAERCIRGSVIMRKICYGTSSDSGDKFRSRVLSIIETCKKHKLSPFDVISEIATAVTAKRPYPDVFDLAT